MNRYEQAPGEVLDYGIDWYLALGGASIVSSQWAASDEGVTIVKHSFSPTVASVWLSEVVVGNVVYLTNTVMDQNGREHEASFAVIGVPMRS